MNTNREKPTLEGQVAEAILEKPLVVTVGGVKYEVAQPSIGTLILVSEAISRLPTLELHVDTLVEETLAVAQDCKPIAEALAIMILGAKRILQDKAKRQPWYSRFTQRGKPELAALTQRILTEVTPRELSKTFGELLGQMQIADFFGLTTSLLEVNLLRRTRGVGGETTASGQA